MRTCDHIFQGFQDSQYDIKDINWMKRNPNNFNPMDGFA